jgi:hypothetical protein
MDAARFPAVSGSALDGTPFRAPADLTGARTLAMIGFGIEQRAELESWVPYMDELVRSNPGVRARLFIPLGVPKIVRGGLVAAMKAAVTQPELRASTIPLFLDVGAFCDVLGIAGRAELVVLVLDGDGRVVWRGGGAFSPPAGASVSAALAGA